MSKEKLHPAVYGLLGLSAVGVIVAIVLLEEKKASAATPPPATGAPPHPLAQPGGNPAPSAAQLSSGAFIVAAQLMLSGVTPPLQMTPPYGTTDQTGIADVRFGQALTLYQAQMGIPVTGVLDSATWATLEANMPAGG